MACTTASRPVTVMALADLHAGPGHCAPDPIEGFPGMSGFFGDAGARAPVRVSVVLVTGSDAVEYDSFYSHYPREAAERYATDNAAALAGAVSAAGADSY